MSDEFMAGVLVGVFIGFWGLVALTYIIKG
jgi:hypothetical protein